MSGGRLALRGEVGSLSRVSWKALLDRYHRKKVHARYFMKPNAPNVRHSVFDERFFHHHRANQGVHVGVIMRRSPSGAPRLIGSLRKEKAFTSSTGSCSSPEP